MPKLAVLLLALFAMALPAHAQAVRVTDGDTLMLAGQRVRLWGIDAPELHQRCPDRWLAGIEATRAMRALVTTTWPAGC